MNVLLYAMDSLRADHLHAYGYYRATTPALDKLASEGVFFENCYVQGGWTAPSSASLLSSQYPSHTGVRKMRDPLNPAIPWLPEILQKNGFETAGFSAIYQMSKLRGYDRGFDVFYDLFKDQQTIERCKERDLDARGDDYCLPLSEDIHTRALEWLDGREARGMHQRPFFMLLWSIDTHEPFRQPTEYNVDCDPDYRGFIDGTGRPFRWVRNRRDLRHLIDIYDGSLRYQDEQFGKLMAALRERKLLDDTLVVVFGDHGEMFFEHGVAGHGKFPWQELLRVPFIMHHPASMPAGLGRKPPVQLLDLAPTVLSLAGVSPEPRFRGTSLAPLINGELQGKKSLQEKEKQAHRTLVIEEPFPFHHDEYAHVVLEGRWKYIEYHPPPLTKRIHKCLKEVGRALTVLIRPGMAPILYGHHFRRGFVGLLRSIFVDPLRFLMGKPTRRLFDLAADPTERCDLFHAQPEIAKRLKTQITALKTKPQIVDEEAKLTESTEPSHPYTPETEQKVLDHLKSLGYVE